MIIKIDESWHKGLTLYFKNKGPGPLNTRQYVVTVALTAVIVGHISAIKGRYVFVPHYNTPLGLYYLTDIKDFIDMLMAEIRGKRKPKPIEPLIDF